MALDNKNNILIGKSHYQDSSFRQLTGRAEHRRYSIVRKYFVNLILSEIPSGMITSIETEKAKKFDPNITVITAKDIPGSNDVAPIFADEPIFAEKGDLCRPTYQAHCCFVNGESKGAVNEVVSIKDRTPILDLDLAFRKKLLLKPIHFERN